MTKKAANSAAFLISELLADQIFGPYGHVSGPVSAIFGLNWTANSY
jgi:hypothetical protein